MDQIKDSKNVSIEKKPKKKHRLTKLWISLGITITLAVAPIAAFYICFFDGTSNKVERDPNFDTASVMKNMGIDALDNTGTTGTIDVNITTGTFNQMLIEGLNQIYAATPALESVIKGFYLETSDEEYNFMLDIDAYGVFKTRLKILTSLENSEVDGNEAFIFKINDIKIGLIGGFYNFAKEKLSTILNDSFLNGLFGNLGLSFTSDIENNRIYYLKSSIPSDINHFLNNTSTLYSTMLEEFFLNGLFDLAFKKEGLSGSIDLQTLSQNEDYVTSEKMNTVAWQNFNDNIEDWLKNEIIPESLADNAFEYLIKGRTVATSELNAALSGKDLSSYGISDPTTYEGVIVDYGHGGSGKIERPEKTLDKVMQDQINYNDITSQKLIGKISESDLNKTFGSSNAIGNYFLLERKTSDGDFKVNTFLISNLYVNVFSDCIKMVFDISINGYDTYVCLKALYSSFDNYKISFTIDELLYGSYACSDAYKDVIWSLFKNALSTDDTFSFSDDGTNKVVSVNFAQAVEDSGFKAVIDATGSPKLTMDGATLADEGHIIISIEQKQKTDNHLSVFYIKREEFIVTFAKDKVE